MATANLQIHRMQRYPKHNRRGDIVDYMLTWAEMLEEKIIELVSVAAA